MVYFIKNICGQNVVVKAERVSSLTPIEHDRLWLDGRDIFCRAKRVMNIL